MQRKSKDTTKLSPVELVEVFPAPVVIEQCPCCGGEKRSTNGAVLRWERERAGLSVREVARRMGVSAAYLSDIERNRRGRGSEIIARFDRAVAGTQKGRR